MSLLTLKVTKMSSVTFEQIAQYNQLRELIATRIDAIFKIWSRFRQENGIDCGSSWQSVEDWSVTDYFKQVSVDIFVDPWTSTNWCFPIRLLSVNAEELEKEVGVEFQEWVKDFG